MAPKENPIAYEDEEDIPGDEEPIEGDEKLEEDEEELIPGKALEEDEKEDSKDKSRTAHHVISSAIPFLFKFVRFSNGKDSANEGSLPSSKMGAVDTTTLGALRPKIPVMSPKSHTFCLQDGTAVRDDTTVEEYFDMDHQVVSSSTPTPAVTIRFKSHRDKTHSAASAAADKTERLEKLHKLQEDLAKLGPDHTFTDHTAQELKRKVQLLDTEERIDAAAYKPSEMTSSKFISAMDEDDWDAVIRNCSVMHGWCIDPKNARISRAPKAAFKLRSGLNMPDHPNKPTDPDKEGTTEDDSTEDAKEVTKKAPPPPGKEVISQKSFPSYTIEDESAVEISVVEHQYEMSMAANDFSAHTFEASVSGGFGPYSAGVTGGLASEVSTGKTGTESTFSKTMVATYKFPRVTIQIPSEDLEPTQELKNAIEHFNTTKDLSNLFKIRSTFGDFFSHVVVLGGRLQTTKIMSKAATSDEATQKEKFKASVGASFSSTFVSGSAKYGQESGKGTETATTASNVSETLTFDARGGNTILAADPPSWCASVYDFHNWRVIGQSNIINVERTIGSICKYPFGERWFPSVERWFAQAVPRLNMYLKIPNSSALSFRMKAVGDQIGPYSYLAHLPKAPVTPVHTYSVIPTGTAIFPHKNLFSPACTQAPVLIAFDSDYYGAKPMPPPEKEPEPKDDSPIQTLWKFIVPFDEFLQHGSLVQLQPHNGTDTRYLTVYRNRQGIFLPTIAGSSEPAYWRVLRVIDPMNPEETKIKDGDSIRLCWRFSDQKVGFRDFMDDTFGRHSHQIPSDPASQELYFKTPFPCFNKPNSGSVFLAMSHQQASHTEDINFVNPSSTKYSRQYLLFDLKFRLDSVKTSRVEVEDNYMFQGTENDHKGLIREPEMKSYLAGYDAVGSNTS